MSNKKKSSKKESKFSVNNHLSASEKYFVAQTESIIDSAIGASVSLGKIKDMMDIHSVSMANVKMPDISALNASVNLTNLARIKDLMKTHYVPMTNVKMPDISALNVSVNTINLDKIKNLTQTHYVPMANVKMPDISALNASVNTINLDKIKNLTQTHHASMANVKMPDMSALNASVNLTDLAKIKDLMKTHHASMANVKMPDMSALNASVNLTDLAKIKDLMKTHYVPMANVKMPDMSALNASVNFGKPKDWIGVNQIVYPVKKAGEDIYYEELDLGIYLAAINSEYERIWKGAIDSWYSVNPDKFRHSSVSIRQLFLDLFLTLAPVNDIKNWSMNELYYNKNGQPNYRGKMLYICRFIKDKELVERMADDTIQHLDFLNGGTHRIKTREEQRLIDESIRLLNFIIDAYYEINN